jgi:hypothetical protein
MKPHRNLIRWPGTRLYPHPGILQQQPKLSRNPPKLNAQITLCQPQLPGPSPNLSQHVPVQIPHELLSQQIPLPPQRPFLTTRNIRLFRRIQFMAERNVSRNQPPRFFQGERCRSVTPLFEDSRWFR